MQLPLFEKKPDEVPKSPARPTPDKPIDNQWATPERIVEHAVDVLGAIDLDPCSDSKGAPSTPAKRRYRLDDNPLSLRWQDRVWLCPPSGRAIVKWVNKLVNEYETGDVTAAIALLPARPDTQWWQRVARYPICLIRGRLHYANSPRPASYASAVIYLGPFFTRFASSFSPLGTIYTPFGVGDVATSRGAWGTE